MSAAMCKRFRGFSLVELVIVVVIIGIIGAIAIPRLSRGSAGASENSLRGNLSVLRSAIELYAAEHDGAYPTEDDIAAQLTMYTDSSGNTNATKTSTFAFGPYLQAIPPLPVGTTTKGNSGIDGADGAGVGWIYTEATGKIVANTAATDSRGVAFSSY